MIFSDVWRNVDDDIYDKVSAGTNSNVWGDGQHWFFSGEVREKVFPAVYELYVEQLCKPERRYSDVNL